MRENEKTWVTAVTTIREYGTRTTFLRTNTQTDAVEIEKGVKIVTTDHTVVMYVTYESLVCIEFDSEDPDAKEG